MKLSYSKSENNTVLAPEGAVSNIVYTIYMQDLIHNIYLLFKFLHMSDFRFSLQNHENR
jgi:hypothetical protein